MRTEGEAHMNRSRKWIYVAQEAQRLADLKLSSPEIARRLGVERQTVTRWIASGKLRRGGRTAASAAPVVPASGEEQTAEQWAASVRQAYDLDVTDDQLVTLAEAALSVARDPGVHTTLRLQAMGRYQHLVKQLALVARAADANEPEVPKRKVFEPPARTGTDPRGILTGLK